MIMESNNLLEYHVFIKVINVPVILGKLYFFK